MAVSLDEFKKGMERLDVRDFRTKKIWRAFEYYKSDRKRGVKTSVMLGYSGYEDVFIIDVFGVSISFKNIEKERTPFLNKYRFISGEPSSTIVCSFMKKLEDCQLKITKPEHIEMLLGKVQTILNKDIFPFVDQYSNIDEVAKEIATKERKDLPFDITCPCPQATAMLFLKQTNSPVYKDKLRETAEDLKQYVDGDVKERGLESAEGSIDVLKMFEELLHDDLEAVGYDFHHDFFL